MVAGHLSISVLTTNEQTRAGMSRSYKCCDELDIFGRNGHYRFRFKNQEIKDCLWEGGSILELHTCHKEARHSSHCMLYMNWRQWPGGLVESTQRRCW